MSRAPGHPRAALPPPAWFVYLARCADDSLYAGVTTDLARRERAHNGTARGARYTRGRRPVVIVWCEPCADRGAALRLEHALKRLPRALKQVLGAWSAAPR